MFIFTDILLIVIYRLNEYSTPKLTKSMSSPLASPLYLKVKLLQTIGLWLFRQIIHVCILLTFTCLSEFADIPLNQCIPHIDANAKTNKFTFCDCSLYQTNTSMSPLWRVLFVIYVVGGSTRHEQEAMSGFILHQFNPACGDVDTNTRIPCTLTNQDDYQKIMSVNSHRPSSLGQIKPGCKDNNMTCLPLSLKPVEYICACAAQKGDLNNEIGWNDTWEEINETGLAIKRGLCNTQAGWCLDGMFKTNLMYLVKTYAPLDALTLVLLNCFNCIFRHLKLELLTQFPASNDEKYRYFSPDHCVFCIRHTSYQGEG